MSMLSSVKPQPWPLSPALTEAPELWRGVAAMFPFWEKSGDIIYDLDAHKLTGLGSNIGSDSWVSGGLRFENNKSTYFTTQDPIFNSTSPVFGSIVVSFSLNDYTKQIWQNMCGSTATDSFSGFYMAYDNRELGGFFTNNGLKFYTSNGSGNKKLVGADNAVKDNKKHTYIVTFDGSHVNGYCDGYKVFGGPDEFVPSTRDVLIGSTKDENGNATQHFDGTVYNMVFYNRILNINEIRCLSQDPFAMLRPRSDL